MIEVKALCAICGPSMYYEQESFRYYASGSWVECVDLSEALDLAAAGVSLKTAAGHTIKPRAMFLVNGTGLCGYCIRSLTPEGIRRQIMAGHPWGDDPRMIRRG